MSLSLFALFAVVVVVDVVAAAAVSVVSGCCSGLLSPVVLRLADAVRHHHH